ncbi:MAG TPA: PLP-dependent aminotransferase family protein [Mycobacterium sp.]|nr:PLP-dependent aminotransferase family protein [Mycobacterium sp.]
MSGSNSVISEQTNSGDDGGFPTDLLVWLDRSERRGLGTQLQQQLRSAIQTGRLSSGTVLPPSRTLARELGVARSVVVAAYEHLAVDGYLSGRQGSGTRVLPIARAVSAPPASNHQPAAEVRLIGGLPDPSLFPRAEWLRNYRAALSEVPNRQLGYPGPLGALRLRDALAHYIARVRGVATTADQLLITSGLTQAVVVVARALKARGVDAVAVEDPCFGFHREAIANTGLQVVPVPVQDDGLDVANLLAHNVGAVLVAPAHSYPTGMVLSASRRAALIKWADDNDGLIIEDDYDAEFRYDRAPIGALQGLAPERVAYGGCVSKTLTPALRLGWLALPSWLVDGVVRQKLLDDMGNTMLEQLALALFIETGGLTRHLRRVRPVYRRRRDTALSSIATSLPDAVPSGVAAGLHVYLQLPNWCDELSLIEAARTRGLLVEGASWHWSDPSTAPPALVIGYGAISEPAIRDGLAILGSFYERQRH